MRCPECRGEIERPGAFCPHCGISLTGAGGDTRPGSASDSGDAPRGTTPNRERGRPGSGTDTAAEIARIGQRISRDPTARKIATGVIGGAIVGAVLPAISWFAGAAVGGGLVAYNLLKKK